METIGEEGKQVSTVTWAMREYFEGAVDALCCRNLFDFQKGQ